MRRPHRIPLLGPALDFPDPSTARPDGLLAVGGDLSTERLLRAYGSGIFPWSDDPVTWWSPDPRAVIPLEGLHISRSLRRSLKRPWTITRDRAFASVIRACAEPAPGREETWIGPAIEAAYLGLHEAGHAHSLEVWLDGELAGGIYGVALGGLFAGESMFHRVTDASKVALIHLTNHLREQGFVLFDTQVASPLTLQMGAADIPRADYLRRLRQALRAPARF